MRKRPISVTIISALFILAGLIGLTYHATEIKREAPFPFGLIAILLVRFLAVVGGVCLLRGENWARWLLVFWLAYHVVLSAFHSASQAITHAALLAVIAFFLFRPRVSEFLRGKQPA